MKIEKINMYDENLSSECVFAYQITNFYHQTLKWSDRNNQEMKFQVMIGVFSNVRA